MSVPIGEVDVINMGLALISMGPISSIRPGKTTVETICATQYDACRQETLYKHPWNFAKRRYTCQRTRTPEFDYEDAYGLPADFIRFLNIKANGETVDRSDYDFEDNPSGGREILMNNGGATTIQIEYIADVTDVSKWSPSFKRMVSYFVALHVAFSFTNKSSDVQRINQLIAAEWPELTSIDGQELPPKRIQNSRLLRARRRLGSYYDGMYTNFDD